MTLFIFTVTLLYFMAKPKVAITWLDCTVVTLIFPIIPPHALQTVLRYTQHSNYLPHFWQNLLNLSMHLFLFTLIVQCSTDNVKMLYCLTIHVLFRHLKTGFTVYYYIYTHKPPVKFAFFKNKTTLDKRININRTNV